MQFVMRGAQQSVKDVILGRLQENGDFPAMSNTMNMINQLKAAEDASVTELANIVLRDYALTSKIIKVVNSVSYSQFGEVTTISRAVNLLGFENIKNLCLTLMLFGHFREGDSNLEHLDTMIKSFYSGFLAQKLCGEVSFENKEEAFICSLLHNFGKMLISFALPETIKEIKSVSRQRGISEDAAALSVLGGRYEEIGMAIAKGWNFPTKIIRSMHKLSRTEVKDSSDEIDQLISIASLSNEISNILSSSSEKKEMDERLGKLADMFKTTFSGLNRKVITGVINESLEELNQFSTIFHINLDSVPFNRQLMTWSDKVVEPSATVAGPLHADFTSEQLKSIDVIAGSEKEDTPDSVFSKGLHDVTCSLLSSFSLNDIIRIVLETIYRGMQLSGDGKVLFLIKDTKFASMSIKFGIGSGIQEMKKWFTIPIGDSNDIFNIAVAKQHDLVIKDLEPAAVRKLLPEWFKNRVLKKTFIVLLPIIINNKPVGLIYVEGDKEGFQKVSAEHLNYLKMLRDQTVMAIRQKQSD
ncbi:MAG: HDOD domain-containing protein [Dissulfurispiraceae bacterium]